MTALKEGALVLYKSRPAVIAGTSDKIEIELPGGLQKRVRPKDISVLHPGPARLSELTEQVAATEEAWELLQGEEAGFADFAELLYGAFTPASAWGAWQILQDDLHFKGDLTAISSRPAEQVEQIRSERVAAAQVQADWEAFLQRVEQRTATTADADYLIEVERVAHDLSNQSKILTHFGVEAKPEQAHAFLVRCGYWPEQHNPYPRRIGVTIEPVTESIPDLTDSPRTDLTHLAAYAIDDAGNQDPDDAISIDGDRIWVHVADVAALVGPDDPLDLAARERAATLYLPECTVPMLPAALTGRLGMGLEAESPALSIGFRLGADGVIDTAIALTRVRVERLTYDSAEARLDEPGLRALNEIAQLHRAQRAARGMADLQLPEVSIRVSDGEVLIRPLPALRSRALVTECMLMAGEAVGRLCAERGIAVPYAVQPPPAEIQQPNTLSETFAYRRTLRPSQAALQPGLHFGLGLENYVRVTSPLRRYPDLLAHQQLRAMALAGEPFSTDALAQRLQVVEPLAGRIRRAERLSNLHWKLVWLQSRPDWEGEAVVVAMDERKALLLIPELALESRIRRNDSMQLDQQLRIRLQGVDLPAQLAHFRVLD